MSKEQYVKFETAQHLKDKGFDWEVRMYYAENGDMLMDFKGNFNSNAIYGGGERVSCPTQQMAMRWLREEKDIDIIPFHEKLPNDCYWCRIERNLYTAHEQEPIYSTYEDAVDAALEYCLTNLI